jgi:glycosyltransferase involved in cell wall biosynthesis
MGLPQSSVDTDYQVKQDKRRNVCVIGAGTRFLSGISYYTLRLANALVDQHETSVILMRQLLPTFLYPGRKRVGQRLTTLSYREDVHVFDGVDWYWLPSLFRMLTFLMRQRPEVVIFQWWTGTVLHSYTVLALAASLLRAKIIIEFHEVLDPGESRLLPARLYVKLLIPLLLRQADGFVVLSEYDKGLLERHYWPGQRPVVVLPLASFDHYQGEERFREAPEDCCNILFFGVIRPYKGLEDLIEAFDTLSEHQISRYWLTVVGEPWEGWTLPLERISHSRYRKRITFVNRYVRDEEVAGFFRGADIVALPYHRSSASGPLHVAMSWGLPVVVTQVGGLVEAAADYRGAVFVPPCDPAALSVGLERAEQLRGQRFDDPHSWARSVASYEILFQKLCHARCTERQRSKTV